MEYCQFDTRVNALRPPAWDKILLLLDNLKLRTYVVWLDADVKISNVLVTVKSIFGMYPLKKVIYTPDMHNKGINTGVMFVRNSSLTTRYLHRIYNYTQFISNPWWEQAAILHDRRLYPDEFERDHAVVDHEYLNFVGERPLPFFAFAQHPAGGYGNGLKYKRCR